MEIINFHLIKSPWHFQIRREDKKMHLEFQFFANLFGIGNRSLVPRQSAERRCECIREVSCEVKTFYLFA